MGLNIMNLQLFMEVLITKFNFILHFKAEKIGNRNKKQVDFLCEREVYLIFKVHFDLY